MNPVTIELLNQCDENLADSLMGVQEGSNTNETLWLCDGSVRR